MWSCRPHRCTSTAIKAALTATHTKITWSPLRVLQLHVSTVPPQGTVSKQQSPLNTPASCTGSSTSLYSSHHPPRLLRARLRCCCELGPPPSLRTALPPPPPPPPRLPLPVAPPAEPLACLLLPPRCVRLGFSLGFQAPLPRCCIKSCHSTARQGRHSTAPHTRPFSNTPSLRLNGAGTTHATDSASGSDSSNSNRPCWDVTLIMLSV